MSQTQIQIQIPRETIRRMWERFRWFYLRNYPVPLAPTLEDYDTVFPPSDVLVGIEWEYTEDYVARPSPPRDSPLFTLVASVYENMMYVHDGSGTHEVPLPPCSLRDFACALTATAMIVAAAMPIIQDGKCGRHIHVSPALHFDRLESLYVAGKLQASFAVTAPFTASVVSRDGSYYVARFRRYLLKYSKISNRFDDHHNFISLNRQAGVVTLELRWNEQVPAIAYPAIAGIYMRGFDVDAYYKIKDSAVYVDVKSVESFVESLPQPGRDVLAEYLANIGHDTETASGYFLRSLDTFNAYLSDHVMYLFDLYEKFGDSNVLVYHVAGEVTPLATCAVCAHSPSYDDLVDESRPVAEMAFRDYVHKLVARLW